MPRDLIRIEVKLNVCEMASSWKGERDRGLRWATLRDSRGSLW